MQKPLKQENRVKDAVKPSDKTGVNCDNNVVVVKLGTIRQLTGRTWQGAKDDGSETQGNDKYHTD